MRVSIASGLVTVMACSVSAPIAAHVEKVQPALHQIVDYDQSVDLLHDNIKRSPGQLLQIARRHNNALLLHSVQAYNAATPQVRKFIGKKDFLEMALFAESKFGEHTKTHQNYFHHKRSGLPLSLEHDPELNTTFILLNKRNKGVKLGEGMFKKVVRAVQYKKHPEVVARATQSRKMDRELGITKRVHGMPGVFETRGFASHKAYGHKSTSIYSKIYNSGSLQDVFDESVKLSKWERLRMALSLISGLHSLQSKGIVHRDLGCRNYLVNIPSGKKGRRHVEAVIADLGCGDYAVNSVRYKVQGNRSYTSPEGIFKRKMKRDDYYKSDIFALGTVLFQLFYGHPPDWQRHCWVKSHSEPKRMRYHSMVQCIHSEIDGRISKLRYRKAHGGLKPMKEAKLLMFEMVNPNPDKRPSTHFLKQRMQEIFNKADK